MGDEIEAFGAFTTAGLAARAMRRRTGAVAQSEGHDAVCLNCGTTLVGDYCHVCGQLGHVHRSIAHMGEELLHGVAHFDGKAWRTLPLLAFKPGYLTREYVNGRRASFVSPMALFLFVVFLMFMVFSFAPHHEIATRPLVLDASTPVGKRLVQDFSARAAEAHRQLEGDVAAGRDPIVAGEKVAEWEAVVGKRSVVNTESGVTIYRGVNVDTGIPWIDGMAGRFSKNPDLLLYKLKNTAYKFSFLLVPISLPFIWLMFFWRRDVKMYDHAVFALYSLSFMSLLFTVAVLLGGIDAVPSWWVGLLVCVAPPIHIYKQLKYAYGLSRFGAAWRTFMMLLFSAVTLTLFASAILALGVAD